METNTYTPVTGRLYPPYWHGTFRHPPLGESAHRGAEHSAFISKSSIQPTGCRHAIIKRDVGRPGVRREVPSFVALCPVMATTCKPSSSETVLPCPHVDDVMKLYRHVRKGSETAGRRVANVCSDEV